MLLAISAYFRLVDNEEWDEIYNQDCRYFTELNSRDTYIEYLKSIYTGRKTSDMKYSFTDTDGVDGVYEFLDLVFLGTQEYAVV